MVRASASADGHSRSRVPCRVRPDDVDAHTFGLDDGSAWPTCHTERSCDGSSSDGHAYKSSSTGNHFQCRPNQRYRAGDRSAIHRHSQCDGRAPPGWE
jgi:hypothetical protein